MKLYRKKSDLFALSLVGLVFVLISLEWFDLQQFNGVVGFLYFILFFIYIFIISKRESKQAKTRDKSGLNK